MDNTLFESLRECEIAEGIATVRRNYLDTDKITQEDFDRIKEGDPTDQKKYMDWMAKQFVKEGKGMDEIVKLVGEFHEVAEKDKIENADINQYTFDKLFNAVGEAMQKETRGEAAARKKEGFAKVRGEVAAVSHEAPDASVDDDEDAKRGGELEVTYERSDEGDGTALVVSSEYFDVREEFTIDGLRKYGDDASWCVAYNGTHGTESEGAANYTTYVSNGDYFYVITVLQDIHLPHRYQPGDPLLLDKWAEEVENDEEGYFVFAAEDDLYAIEVRSGNIVNIWDSSDKTISGTHEAIWMAITGLEVAESQPESVVDDAQYLGQEEDEAQWEAAHSDTYAWVEKKLQEVIDNAPDDATYAWYVDDPESTDENDTFMYDTSKHIEDSVQKVMEDMELYDGSQEPDLSDMVDDLKSDDETLVAWTNSVDSIYEYFRQSKIFADYASEVITDEVLLEYAKTIDRAIVGKYNDEGKYPQDLEMSEILDMLGDQKHLDSAAGIKSGTGEAGWGQDFDRDELIDMLSDSRYTNLVFGDLNSMSIDELIELARDVRNAYDAEVKSSVVNPAQMKMAFAERRRLESMLRELNG